jgi:DNA primase
MPMTLEDFLRAEDFLLNKCPSALQYLSGRRISEDTIRKFHLGVMRRKGVRNQYWISLPIFDSIGNLAGCQFRLVDGSYTNKKFRYLFPKTFSGKPFRVSTLLFGLYQSKPAMLETRRAFLVEGAFDCLSLFQAGFPAVAMFSSSLSDYQYFLLARYVDEIILIQDGDEAGRKSAERVKKICDSYYTLTGITFSSIDVSSKFHLCKDVNDALVLFGEDGLREKIGEEVAGVRR